MSARRRWTRRQFLTTTAAAAAAAASGLALPARAQDKPGSMVYSTYGGDFGRWMKESFEVPFTKATGIDLVHDIGQNPARYAKMKTFRHNPRFQLINLQDRYLYESTRDGLLASIDYDQVPNAADIGGDFKTATWLGYMYFSIGIVYNADKVKDPPKHWDDLLDTRYKGRIFIDAFNHFGLHTVVAMSLANGGSYENMAPGFKMIHEMAKRLNPRFISTSQEGMELLRTGQVDVAAWQNTRAYILERKGHPIRYVVPASGDVSVVYGNAIVKNSGDEKWSEKFLNYTAAPELQAKLVSDYYPATPTNPHAQPSPAVEKLIKRPAGAKQFTLNYAEVLPRLADWQKRWNEAIAS